MLMRLFHSLRLAISQNGLARWLNSNGVHERFHSQGWEPEVLQCLMTGEWNGPVWDVGASLGRHTYRLARKNQVFAFEPNLNVLQFLAYNLLDAQEVVIVPCALTPDGRPMKATCNSDFMATPTGPQVATLSVAEALRKFGRPGLIKIDIEGGEYELLKCPELKGIPLLIEWHGEIPKELSDWNLKTIDEAHSLLTPKTA